MYQGVQEVKLQENIWLLLLQDIWKHDFQKFNLRQYFCRLADPKRAWNNPWIEIFLKYWLIIPKVGTLVPEAFISESSFDQCSSYVETR